MLFGAVLQRSHWPLALGSQVSQQDAAPLIAALVSAVEPTSLSADAIVRAAWDTRAVVVSDFAQVGPIP